MNAQPQAPDLAHKGNEGLIWPAVLSGDAAQLAALIYQFEQSQWFSADALVAQQHRQLARTAAHAEAHSEYFRWRLRAAGLQARDLSTREGLAHLPVMGRRDLQDARAQLFCGHVPQDHGPTTESSTSGSCGLPVVVRRTALNRLIWMAMTLREHLWQRRDFRGRLAVIRNDYLERPQEDWPSWGTPASLLFETGTSHGLTIQAGVERQIDWLCRVDPDYLLVYPSNLMALLERMENRGLRLQRLRQVRTINETLGPAVRDAAARVLGVEIADTYSSSEVGVIAIQCPETGLYHTMAEGVIVEVLDERDRVCAPGAIGRVVVSDLHNFSTPLIRYELGDYAEPAGPCSCGRGLPALRRILGRSRNMARLPDGRTLWPAVGGLPYREIAPIRQFQFIQRNLHLIEVRLVSDATVTPEQEQRIGELVRAVLDYQFELQFVYFNEEIPRGAGGKHEEFICLLG